MRRRGHWLAGYARRCGTAMGTTATSLSVLVPLGDEATAVDTIAKTVEKLGYKRLAKPGAAADKHVVLLRPEGSRYLTVFDRDDAALDSGELRELAALVTQKLETAALHASILDSDSGEVVVYHRGKQVDAVGTGAGDDVLVRVDADARARTWCRILHPGVSAEDIAAAASLDSAFAADVLAGWCRAAGSGDEGGGPGSPRRVQNKQLFGMLLLSCLIGAVRARSAYGPFRTCR